MSSECAQTCQGEFRPGSAFRHQAQCGPLCRDDGCGFDFVQEAQGDRKGLGLISLGERLEALNGTFRVKTKPGGGTEIHAWIPFEREEALEKIRVGI